MGVMFKLIKKDIGNHKGKYVLISTETLSEMEGESRHGIILKEGRMEQGGGKDLKQHTLGNKQVMT